MKILFDIGYPVALAHGGEQVQVEQSMKHLDQIGVETEWLQRGNPHQRGDLIHYFGIPSIGYQNLARQKGVPLVCTTLLTAACNYSAKRLYFQAAVGRILQNTPFLKRFNQYSSFGCLQKSACTIVTLHAEKWVLTLNGIPESRIHVVPCGCETEFLEARNNPRTGDYLISHGTIAPRKRVVELAKLAIRAGVPILFVGKPYSEIDPYWLEFEALTKSSSLIRHQRHVENRQELMRLLQGARGFALFSAYENWCISADEAIACGLPVLLPDLRWSRERFGGSLARFFLQDSTAPANATILREFYDECPSLSPLPKPISWTTVAHQLQGIYESMLDANKYPLSEQKTF